MTNLVKKYLDLHKYSLRKTDFEDLFLSHPNYPSVFAVTDSLDALSIENVAVKIPKEQLPELPEYFLAVYQEQLVLVSKNSLYISIDSGNGKIQKIAINQFLTHWNGVILAIEPNTAIEVVEEKIDKKWLLYAVPVLALIVLSAVYSNYSSVAALLLMTSFVGVLTSIFIVQQKLGISNEVVSRFCSSNPNASCDLVIQSKKSDISTWIGFSDLPLLFFGVNFLAIILQPIQSATMVGLLSVLSLPVVGYSIWVQKNQLNKWCALCLVVSFLIVLQSLVFGYTTTSFLTAFSINFFEFFVSMVLLTSIWLFGKPVLEDKIKGERETNGLKKFKRNYDLFHFLSKEVPVKKRFNELKGLHFGNANAPVELTLIVSPSCGHCHTAFNEAYELTLKFPARVSLQVLFNVNPENSDNPYKTVVETLLTLHYTASGKSREAIVDWHSKRMDLTQWKEKWTMSNVDMKANQQMCQQYNWCSDNKFNYTPVKIINGRMFPNEYQISDLKYFLNDFSKEKQSEENEILAEA